MRGAFQRALICELIESSRVVQLNLEVRLTVSVPSAKGIAARWAALTSGWSLGLRCAVLVAVAIAAQIIAVFNESTARVSPAKAAAS